MVVVVVLGGCGGGGGSRGDEAVHASTSNTDQIGAQVRSPTCTLPAPMLDGQNSLVRELPRAVTPCQRKKP